MLKRRNKTALERSEERIVQKNSLMRRKLGLKVGGRVRIIDISSDLKDPNFDLKDAQRRQFRTAELFRFCLGREFTIQDFDRYGFVELDASENPAVRRKFGRFHTIWSEPEFLEKVGRQRLKARSKRRHERHA